MPETASFERSAGSWVGVPCSSAAAQMLEVGVRQGTAPANSFAQWRISAPTAMRFLGGWLQADPATLSAYESRYLYRLEGEAEATRIHDISQAGWFTWPGSGEIAADQLILRTRCIDGQTCKADAGRPGDTMTLARSFGFEIEDYSPPVVGLLGGALMEGAAQRSTQILSVPASDQGSGIGKVTLEVNGDRYATEDPGCALAPDGRALRLSPCPAAPTSHFAVDTTDPAFSEGSNAIEVCVTDYAEETDDPASFAGESCAPARVFVDNSCDVGQARDAADVRFAFGKGGKERRTVRYGDRASVIGTLRDAAYEPIEGATVCVSTRDRLGGAAEIDVEEIETNKKGKARVRLPKGPSRAVKLTYWADEEQVEMRTVDLNVRARPKLKVLSKRRLSDGGKARFRVRLGGPYRGKRKVAVQALAPAGWLDFPGCVGKTNRKGVFRCSYRFREQSGSVKYEFRALAPRQSGYPYLQGRSRSEKVVVRD
ncbi:MAG: hypothetical protein K0S35_398 [Geminicoccaceae bacterium]|nr:hypothetical protein [Geminicoccaceae bacterium]